MPKKAKIFVAEDDESLRNLIKTKLTDDGHTIVLEASSLKEALDKVKQARESGVNVAVLDGSLDKDRSSSIDGPKIAAALRGEVSNIKIVAFTSSTTDWGDVNLFKGGLIELGEVVMKV